MSSTSIPPTPLERLVKLGFMRVGEWKLNRTQLDPSITFEVAIDAGDKPNILYAFVVSAEVLYIGKSLKTLKKRLDGYQRPGKSQFTNIRSNAKILDLLLQEKGVEIYLFVDNGLFSYGEFHLNLAAGLEDSLIDILQPTWNLSGLGK